MLVVETLAGRNPIHPRLVPISVAAIPTSALTLKVNGWQRIQMLAGTVSR
jgi:hypothetical protein